MLKTLLLLLHNALFPIGLLFMAPGAWRKMKARGGHPRDLWQRAGFFTPDQQNKLHDMRQQGPVLWIHAASVGEVGIAARLISEMLKRQPHLHFALTTTTPTGYAQAAGMKAAQQGAVLPLYSALDGWFIVRRFLNAICPQQLILVEAEVWPNLTHACLRRQIPVYLVNARLSPRSERRFRKFLPLTKCIFSMLRQVMVQEPEDVARWLGLGMRPDQVTLTGSIKFDPGGMKKPQEQIAQFQQDLSSLGWPPDAPSLLLASTHAGEEAALAKVYAMLKEKHPALKLMIVPRHVERAAEIQRELKPLGLSVAMRQRLAEDDITPDQPDVLLINTTGELRAWQFLATIVIIGKSFLAHGGQNPSEAIMAGKAVVFGPNMENFAALITQFLEHKGAVQVADIVSLDAALHELLNDPQSAATLAENGLKALQLHAGATQRTADFLLKEMKP